MKCAKCDEQTVGNSKYCKIHKIEARRAWVEMIQGESQAREAKKAQFEVWWSEAIEAGKQAAAMVVPEPMLVVQRENPLDDSSRIVREFPPVWEGVCGFAWVSIKGNTSFARWASKHAGFRKAYGGGLQYWVSAYGQSLTRKEAFAVAAANILASHGIVAFAGSRMD